MSFSSEESSLATLPPIEPAPSITILKLASPLEKLYLFLH